MTELIQAEVGPAIRENSVMFPLMKVADITNMPTKAASFQFAAGVSASAITEGTAITNTEWTLTEAVATAAQAGVLIELTDLGVRSTVADIVSAVSTDLAAACVDKFDVDAAALMNGFSNKVGTSGSALTLANMLAAITKLRINAKGLASNAVFVLYPEQVGDIQAEVLGTSTGLAAALSRENLVAIMGDTVNSAVLANQPGSFMGVPVFQSNNVPATDTGANSGGGLFCAGAALGAAWKWAPTIESQRGINNGQISTVLLASVCYGVIELRDALGISIETDR